MTTTLIIDPQDTLGQLVEAEPSRATVLDGLDLDFCCHGHRTLAEACADSGISVTVAVTALANPVPSPIRTGTGDALDGLAGLADHIETTHHAYLHAELPSLTALAAKVVGVHADRHPELASVNGLLAEISADLGPHLAREERVVFPTIRRQARGLHAGVDLDAAVKELRAEHEQLGRAFTHLRAAANGYRAPDDGCASYRAFYRRLAHLESDTHMHIHLENNVLFPAALAAPQPSGRPSSVE